MSTSQILWRFCADLKNGNELSPAPNSCIKTRLVAIILALSATSMLGAPPLYRVVDLGTLGGDYGDVTSISEAGHVAGLWATGADNDRGWPVIHAFLWFDGEMRDLGSLEGPLGHSEAVAVNSAGHVVGRSIRASEIHAFLWLPEPAFGLPAGMNDLDLKGENDAWDINERSEIVGTNWTNDWWVVFLWLPHSAFGMDAGLNELCRLDWDQAPTVDCPVSYSGAINDVGQITAGGFLWLPWPAFGRAAGWSRYLYGGGDLVTHELSHSGFVVGMFPVQPQGRGSYFNYWLADDRSEAPAPELVEQVNGLNEFDDVVGSRWLNGNVTPLLRRGAYTGEGFLDLNDFLIYSDDWRVLWGSDINNVGQIAGVGYHVEFEYESHPVLLEPVRTDIDRSGRVDMEDVRFFTWCLDGPSNEPDYECMYADLDGENDVDLRDFQAIQLRFGGGSS